MRRNHRRHRDRWAVPQLHPAARAAGEQDRAPGRHRHDRTACGVCGLGTARGADGPVGGGGECAPVVRVDVSHSKARHTGMDKMKLSVISYRLSAVVALIRTRLTAHTSLSIYFYGRIIVR